jgi:hypothetical protein
MLESLARIAQAHARLMARQKVLQQVSTACVSSDHSRPRFNNCRAKLSSVVGVTDDSL